MDVVSIVSYMLLISFNTIFAEESCWWTGCQNKNWAVRGCESYNRSQSNIRDCENGNEYYCCPKPVKSNPTDNSQRDCWWSGCQKKDWAVRGCESYNRTQADIRDCENGNEYYCCLKEKESQPKPPEGQDCWWTGCQKNDWAVRGCASFNRSQSGIRDCDNGNEYYCCPKKPINSDGLECYWSACQQNNLTWRGCPADMIKIGSQSCGGDEGDIFHCCYENKDEEEVETMTGGSFVDFVKYLLMKGRNFTLEPDSVPCLSVDVEKQAILQIGSQGIYICDLCPNFPHNRLVNVFLNNIPMDIQFNTMFPECFGYCFDKNDCVAFSYDHVEHTCYIFNNTVAMYVSESKWTTVLMAQPVGVLESWTYSRHTFITGNPIQTSTETSFKDCLKKCNGDAGCNYLSYSYSSHACLMFDSEENINYIDLHYGSITALRISILPVGNDPSSRFIEEGESLSISKSVESVGVNQKCSNFKNNTHSANFYKECFTSDMIGCDLATGCKLCYYPEKTNNYENLPICPDSEVVMLNQVKEYIVKTMKNCLNSEFCIGVGYDSKTQDIDQITFTNMANIDFTTKFLLRYPIGKGEDQLSMTKYDFLSNYDIQKLSNHDNTFQETTGNTLKECLSLYSSDDRLIRMSFSNGKCKLSSGEVKFIYQKGNYVTVFKKPDIKSQLINFVRTPGFAIPTNNAKNRLNQCNDCEETCALKCNEEFSDWCSHYSIEFDTDTKTCFFFDFLSDSDAEKTNLKANENAQILTKLSKLDFTLESLNKLSPFQPSDIYNCFAGKESEQTQTSLSVNDKNSNSDTNIALRRKRGFFDFIKKAVKAVGNFVVNTVKDIVKPVIDTAKGVVDSVKNVVKGDMKAAKESFMKIPIVKDVKNAVELGKAVVTGDWDKAKEKGADLLQSSTLNIATSVIPVGGRFIGTGLKTIGKQIGKTTSKISKGSKNTVSKNNGNGKKVKKDNPNDKKDKEIDNKRNQCKSRPKRELRGTKRKRHGECDDDDKKEVCTRPVINKVIEDSMSGCNRKVRNAICEYECEPGYEEPKNNVKCVQQPQKDAFWSPKPDCDLIHCQNTPFPLIALNTPHISSFGTIEFGKHLTAYVVLYNKNRRLPVWSIALHQSNKYKTKDYTALKISDRAEDFKEFPCPELKNQQAKKTDYKGSGWDRGHLTPANVARWSEKAITSTNLLINIAPQDPYSNQDPWKHLEAHIECYSNTHRSLVATGICSSTIAKTPSGLDVPSCYWKMVCYKDESGKEQVVGFISENSRINRASQPDKTKRALSIYRPKDQKDIKPLYNSALSPWLMSATKINTGRPVQVGTYPTVWFPVNPFDCDKAMEISSEEKDAWNRALTKLRLPKLKAATRPKKPRKPKPGKGGNKKKKPGTSRTKRDTGGGIKRGCNSISELRNMMSLLGYNMEEDIGSDEENEDSENSDDEESGREGNELVTVQSCNKRIIGYYTSWLDKQVEARQLRRLTHVIYAFIEMKADGSIEVGSADRKNAINADEETRKAKERLTNLMDIASLYPHLKVMFAVGGWENSQYFSSVAADPGKRIAFIASIVKMIQRYGFDGVDIDWEYPVTGGAVEGVPQDKQNYVILMKEIRNALDTLAGESGRGEKFLLSFAGAAGQWTLDPGFDLPGLLKYVDFANIMSYDYFGAWSSKWGAYTGPPAPLHFGMPPGFSGKTNVDWSVKHYTCKTKLPHKINMGVPFYGRYWKNVGDPVDGKDGMWRMARNVNGKFEGGYVPYDKIESEFLATGGFENHFHEKSKTPYAWNPGTSTFLGYENVQSLEHKVKYAVDKNIGGLMIWAIEQDDDDLTLLDIVSSASLCDKTDPNDVNFKCIPIDEKRWWTPEDGEDKAGLCGKSAPLYKGYYPLCDPDDPGYNCCGAAGYCGTGEKYCDCPTCKNYGENPDKILEEPTKPTVPVTWYLLNDPEGKRGRCGRKVPKINDVYPTCNPDDENSHCCSNGGYCGNTDEHCKCNGCVDFKSNPTYRYGPKKWWEVADGEDKAGKCGPEAPEVDGIYDAECEPNTKFSCCSSNGYCGSGPEFCDCKGCKKYT